MNQKGKIHKTLTNDEIRILRRIYPYIPSILIAKQFNRNVRQIYYFANSLGLKKCKDFMNSELAGRFFYGNCYVFKKDHIVWNKKKENLSNENLSSDEKFIRKNKFNNELINMKDHLLNFAMTLTNYNRDNALDLVQDTYLRALIYWDENIDYLNLRKWIFSIMKNIFNDYYKFKNRFLFINYNE